QGVVEVVLVVGVKGLQLWEILGGLKEEGEGVREEEEGVREEEEGVRCKEMGYMTEDEIRKNLEHDYMEYILLQEEQKFDAYQ
ncbi:hypothetical protein Tco_0423809, partial [Tanacetum coccineum]